MKFVISFLVLLNLTTMSIEAYPRLISMPRLTTITKLQFSGRNNEKNNQLGGDLVTKGLFGLTELFGKMSNPFMSTSALEDEDSRITKTTSKDLLSIANNIKKEYEKIFWATGNMDTSVSLSPPPRLFLFMHLT